MEQGSGGLRIGLVANNPNFPGAWQETVEKIVLADELGYDTVWLGETWGYDLVTRLTELVLATKRIRIGAGIFNVFSRTPGVLASTIATLDERSGGRIVCGLGSSGAQVIEHWHGVPFDRPLRRLREYTEIINLIMRREPLHYRGEIFTLERGFKLQIAPVRAHVPIYIAAITPRSIDQAGEIADGLLAVYWPASRLPALRAQLDAGAARAGRAPGRAPGSTRIAAYITTVAIADEGQRAAARDVAREPLAFYIGRMGRFYAEMLGRHGYAEEVAAIGAGWRVGPDAARAAVSDRLLDDTAIVGTPAEIRARLVAWHADGLDEAAISLPSGSVAGSAAILRAIIA